MPYTVYYARTLPNATQTPTAFIAGDYLEMTQLEAQTLGEVYNLLQDPKDPSFQALCHEKAIHTSMTAGDVVKDPQGTLWMCAFEGWYTLNPHPLSAAQLFEKLERTSGHPPPNHWRALLTLAAHHPRLWATVEMYSNLKSQTLFG